MWGGPLFDFLTLNTSPLAEISPTVLLLEASADPGREKIGPASASPIAAEVRTALKPSANLVVPGGVAPPPPCAMLMLEVLRSDWCGGRGIGGTREEGRQCRGRIAHSLCVQHGTTAG